MNKEPIGNLIWDPLRQTYVALAAVRRDRCEGAADCAFCADVPTLLESGTSNLELGTRNSELLVPGVAGDLAWSRPNDFPPLTPPAGECRILLYSAGHEGEFATLPGGQVRAVVQLWQAVYADLAERYPCVFLFENRGESIGQTQAHPHGQAYGVAVLPPIIRDELAAVQERCAFCAVLAGVLGTGQVVAETPAWVAFVPPFARLPYQLHVYPRQHVPDMRALPAPGELADLLPRLIHAEDRVLGESMPYMLAWHQLADPRFHLHLELLAAGRAPGKIKFAASSETAYGLWINDADPRETAAQLRAAVGGSW